MLSNEAVELNDLGLEPHEIRDEIICRAQNIANDLGRIACGKPICDQQRHKALDWARLILDQEQPDLAAAQKKVQRLAGHLGTMRRQSWHGLLKELLEP